MDNLSRTARFVKPFDGDFSVSNQGSPLSKPQIPHYTPIPEAIDAFGLDTSSRAVLVALLSKCAHAYDRLLRGQRLTFSLDLPSLAQMAGLSPRATTDAARKLVEADLITHVLRGQHPSLWEVRPTAFGFPEDDVERRRSAANLKRRYTVYPVALAGRLSPIDAAVLQKILQKSGVGLVTRFLAGEEVWVSTTVKRLTTGLQTSEKTVRRSLTSLRAHGLIETRALGRAGLAIQILPAIWGTHETALDAENPLGTNLPVEAENAVIFADQTDPPLNISHEETTSERSGADHAARVAQIYAVLLAIAFFRSRVTTSGIRARLRRAATNLTLAGATSEVVEREGWALARERNQVPSPEAVLDRVLSTLANLRFRTEREDQFSVAPDTPTPEPCDVPTQLADVLDDDERSAWRWRAQLEAGAPGVETFRELLGGLPWEANYIPRRLRSTGDDASPNPSQPPRENAHTPQPESASPETERISIAEGLALVRATLASRSRHQTPRVEPDELQSARQVGVDGDVLGSGASEGSGVDDADMSANDRTG